MNDHDIMKETLFELSDDALYVANGGHTFTREGVIGVCASHLSEKKSNHSDDYECADKDLISEIRKSEIAVYEKKKSRLVEDANQEEEISHDYDGRFAWELLQIEKRRSIGKATRQKTCGVQRAVFIGNT